MSVAWIIINLANFRGGGVFEGKVFGGNVFEGKFSEGKFSEVEVFGGQVLLRRARGIFRGRRGFRSDISLHRLF